MGVTTKALTSLLHIPGPCILSQCCDKIGQNACVSFGRMGAS